MENEIKVGEYGRTNLGKIIKFAWLEDEEGKKYENKVVLVDLMLKETYPYYYFKNGEYIVKHSPNLIDIIEVNDICIMSYNGIVFQKFVSRDDIVALKMKEYKLLEILTKEQFESISYKVKE